MPNQLIKTYHATTGSLKRRAVDTVVGVLPYDWSETNLPWAYTSTSQFTADWPSTVNIVDIQTSSSDFYTNLVNTVNAAGGRCVVRLGQGVYRLNQFRMYGTSGDPQYAFGFFHPNLAGLLGQGADKTYVQMDANSMTQAQLDRLAELDQASFYPVQMGLCRFDGSAANPVYIAGVTFRAADQQMLTQKAADVPIVVPQPAPHNGVFIYGGTHSTISYTRFQAAGRAASSQPPFESANIMSARGTHHWHHCEFDGRRSPDFDPARPRRCGPMMANSETKFVLEDSWFHHSNVSRYAVNDENHSISGNYVVRRVKAEQISNTQNTDPELNNGQSLGGWSAASVFGWESTNSLIEVENNIIIQDNTMTRGREVPMHLQMTSVGARNPQGGRMTVRGGRYRNNGWPQLNDFVCFRITSDTWWYRDGVANTVTVYHGDGQQLTPYQIPGSWPPTAQSLATAGVAPNTHYLVWS